MDTALQRDPRLKLEIRDALRAYLFDLPEQCLANKLKTIVVRNTQLQGYSHQSFMYKGQYYSIDTSRPPRTVRRLHPTLHGEMQEYIAELHDFHDHEQPQIMGFLTCVLNATNDHDAYYRCLPQALHTPLRQLLASRPYTAPVKKLTDEQIDQLIKQYEQPLGLLKQRLMLNLLI